MEIPVFTVDAFTNLPFKGNPAAICPLMHVSKTFYWQYLMLQTVNTVGDMTAFQSAKVWLCHTIASFVASICMYQSIWLYVTTKITVSSFSNRSWVMSCIRRSQQRWTCQKQLSSLGSIPLTISPRVRQHKLICRPLFNMHYAIYSIQLSV